MAPPPIMTTAPADTATSTVPFKIQSERSDYLRDVASNVMVGSTTDTLKSQSAPVVALYATFHNRYYLARKVQAAGPIARRDHCSLTRQS